MAEKIDVLVIGGGSIGLSAAYYLQKSGRSVTIIDNGQIGIGSSSGNAGHIVPSHIVPLAAPGMVLQTFKWLLNPKDSPFNMRVSLDPSYLSFLVRFMLACSKENVDRSLAPLKNLGLLSSANYATIIQEEKLSCNYQETGLLFLYKTERALEGGKHEADLLHRNNMPAEVLSQAQVRQREPMAQDDIIGGVHFTGDSSLNPGVYLQEIRHLIEKRGGSLFDGEKIITVEKANEKITRVQTDRHDFAPQEVVLAGGAWSPQFGKQVGLSIPIQPAKGYSLTIKTTSPLPSQALLLGEKRVAITPLGDRMRITGRLELSRLDTTVGKGKIENITASVCDYLKIDPEWETLDTWAGLRPTTPDGVPIIERSPIVRNLTIAAGHAMLGLSLGPGTGQLVAELVNGQPSVFDLSGFRLGRF